MIAEPPKGYNDKQKIEWYKRAAEKSSIQVVELRRRIEDLEVKYEGKRPSYRY